MQEIESWFLENRRELPWREKKTPYRVWISEVMLQQTRAQTVIPYFLRWMEKFPTVQALSQASLEEVLKMWEGLGYYSRARALRQAAERIVEEFGGNIPSSSRDLASLPGFGPYTVAAVRSFGFGLFDTPIDANVLRVLSRFLGIEKPLSTPVRKEIFDYLQQKRPTAEQSEGLIELGALVCTKNPTCSLCPLRSECRAKQKGLTHAIPNIPPKKSTLFLERDVFVIEAEKHFLLFRGEAKRVFADLYQFPYAPKGSTLPFLPPSFEKGPLLSSQKHTFTHHKAHLFPSWFLYPKMWQVDGYSWHPHTSFADLPFAAGHKWIVEEILSLCASVT